MLVNPKREIDEHISMITGITNEMVQGKSTWSEIRERVASFIGEESIIVGHNVLFDISMFETHGIHLRNHRVLDTFELSELFSGDAESLNLWFLAKKYGFDDGSEHRALDDTKLSINLFLHYLTEVSRLSKSLLSLWEYARNRDESGTIDTLLSLIGNSKYGHSWNHPLLQYSICRESREKVNQNWKPYRMISLSPFWEQEKEIIDAAAKNGKVLIITSSKKQSFWIKEKLSSFYTVSHIRERSSYISLRMLWAWLEKKSWKRKESILILRLVHWLHITKTGSIDEIKWYGDEQSYKYLFELREDEENEFLRNDSEYKKEAEILICESYNKDLKEGSCDTDISTCIIRDIIELEKALSFREKKIIDWSILESDLWEVNFPEEYIKNDLLYALSIIQEIALSVVPRPIWPNPTPPGEYGETYFYTQNDFWHRWYIWLIWAAEKLEESIVLYEKQSNNPSYIEEVIFSRLKNTVNNLIQVIKIGDPNLNLILEIKNWRTTLSLIPRNQKKAINDLLRRQWWQDNILLGYNISTPSIKRFLTQECALDVSHMSSMNQTKVMSYRDLPLIKGDHAVILGTNLKQLRAISSTLRNKYPEYEVLTQGVSGGKSKILHLYHTNNKAILLWLIDTWKDESDLWRITATLTITKIPFDPPSEPFYLARTVGMSNNFELYSIPMAINTINTLIGRAKCSNSTMEIFLSDEKVTTINWGKNILHELL